MNAKSRTGRTALKICEINPLAWNEDFQERMEDLLKKHGATGGRVRIPKEEREETKRRAERGRLANCATDANRAVDDHVSKDLNPCVADLSQVECCCM